MILVYWPSETPEATESGGLESYYERVDAYKVRARSESFGDHYSQVTLDAVIVVGGEQSVKILSQSGMGLYYVQEAYKHLKAIAAIGEGQALLNAAEVPTQEDGIILGATLDDVFTPLTQTMGQHRVWSRDAKAKLMSA